MTLSMRLLGEAMTNWIKTVDQLPEEGVPVFVWNSNWPKRISVASIMWDHHPDEDCMCWFWRVSNSGYCDDLASAEHHVFDDDYQYEMWHPMIEPPIEDKNDE